MRVGPDGDCHVVQRELHGRTRVADPHRRRHLRDVADEPGVAEVVGGARLACCRPADRRVGRSCALVDDALEDARDLVGDLRPEHRAALRRRGGHRALGVRHCHHAARVAADAVGGERGVGARHVHDAHLERAQSQRSVLGPDTLGGAGLHAVGGHAQPAGHVRHVVDADLLLELHEVRVDGVPGRLRHREDAALALLGVVVADAVGAERGDRAVAVRVVEDMRLVARRRLQGQGQRQALLQGRSQREDLEGRPGLERVGRRRQRELGVGEVGRRRGRLSVVGRPVDPVGGDRQHVSGARFDDDAGRGDAVARRDDRVDRVLGSFLDVRVERSTDDEPAFEQPPLPLLRRRPELGVGQQLRAHVLAVEGRRRALAAVGGGPAGVQL